MNEPCADTGECAPYSDLSRDSESIANELVGKLILAFSGIERDIDLYLRQMIDATEHDAMTCVMDKLAFKQKLDALCQVVAQRYADTPACVRQFNSLHKRAERLRRRRNVFVHGCWNRETERFQLLSPARGPSGHRLDAACELSTLREKSSQAVVLSRELQIWREHWSEKPGQCGFR